MAGYSEYAEVVIDGGIDKPLDYGIKKEQVQIGSRVSVTVQGRPRQGTVINLKATPSFKRILPLTDVLPETLPADLVQLAKWMARYYAAPLSSCLQCMLPRVIRSQLQEKRQLFVTPKQTRQQLATACQDLRRTAPKQAATLDGVLKVTKGILLTELLEATGGSRQIVTALVKKGLIEVTEVAVDRSILEEAEFFPSLPKKLNPEQAKAVDAITQNLGSFATHLLYGITGSGKTEVYLQAIARALEKDMGVIVLVPEIALTTQTIERFRSRFEHPIAVLHHRLSDGERRDAWHKIASRKAPIVIGPRSALFSPMPHLGLIIVDEEHEQSYKQSDSKPHYHARDVAVVRGKISGAQVVLGTATPSFETYHNALSGRYSLIELTTRPTGGHLPEITLVDMNREYDKAGGFTLFSDVLLNKIKDRYQKGEQSVIFLNRRGYNAMLFCRSCETSVKCPHCDLSLTFHKGSNALSCHLCSYTLSPPPRTCPTCGLADPIQFRGAGTEQVERQLGAMFPDIRTLRMDGETTRHKGSHQKLFTQFRAHKADLLIGTQMIAKGLHFPSCTLVAVLNADHTLALPDFRASEHLFSLLTQVAGRAGRGDSAGEVLIQTRSPDHPILHLAKNQDFKAFYTQEIESRKFFKYPPFSHFVKLTFSGKNDEGVCRIATAYYQALQLPKPYQTLPVTPCGYAKIKDNYRFQFLIKGPNPFAMGDAIALAKQSLPTHPNVRLSVDIDPVSTFF